MGFIFYLERWYRNQARRNWRLINLSKKIIIVTGAGGAIGSAATRQFTSFGANVVAVDIDDTSITDAFADNDSVLPVQSDVTEPDGILAAVTAAKDRWGRIDGLFSNAGTEGALSRIVDYPVDAFDRLVKLNIRAVFLGLKFILPELQTGGAIVNMSSALGIQGAVDVGPYVASKHAVIGLTRSAAMEAGERNIRVNAVCPGPIESRMVRAHEAFTFEGRDETFADHLPLRRNGTPNEVAALVAFLLSDEAGYITGSAYPIDGGLTT